MSRVLTVNLGVPADSPNKPDLRTGIDKRPATGPVAVRDPGPRQPASTGSGTGSALAGDFIGDARHHGGTDQAVYAFAREDLDRWQDRLGRPVPNGFFGENLTVTGVDPNQARIGEIWRVGDTVELQVTTPRIPCATFRGWVGERGWAKMFTADARPGTYLRVLVPGEIAAGDPVTVVRRPTHGVTVALAYRATVGEPELLPRLLDAGDDLPDDLARQVAERAVVALD